MTARGDSPDTGGPTTILESGDPAVLAVAKSLLDAAEIEYLAKGEGLQNVLPMGSVVQLQVAPEDAEDARELLAELNRGDASR
jgi:hypothetical protein